MANSPNGGTNYRLAHSNKRPKINPPGVTAILNNKSRDAFLPRKFCLFYYIFTEGLSKKKSWLKNSQNLEKFYCRKFPWKFRHSNNRIYKCVTNSFPSWHHQTIFFCLRRFDIVYLRTTRADLDIKFAVWWAFNYALIR